MKRVITKAKTIWLSSDFLRYNAIFFAGSLGISALNYLYYPVLGRLLPPAQFGEVQALVSLFLQATIFLSVITNVAVSVVANQPDEATRGRIVIELERVSTAVMLGAVLLALLAIGPITRFLQFEDPWPIVMLGVSLVASVPLALRQAYLRGVNAFGRLSVAGAIAAGLKLIASAAFVLIGFGTTGALGGLVAAQLVAFAYSLHAARELGLTTRLGRLWRRPDLALLRPHVPYAVLVLIVSLVTTTQFSFDIVLMKHLFPADVAGAYAGVATVARILFFLTGSIAAVLLSNVKLGGNKAANRRLLVRSLGLHLSLSVPVLAVFSVVPEFVIRLLVGGRYLDFAPLLPELSLAIFMTALANLVLTYQLALRRWAAAVSAVAGALTTLVLASTSHDSPRHIITAMLAGSVVMLGGWALDSVRRRLSGV